MRGCSRRWKIEEEIWAPVKDFPDYAISNYGRVLNLTHNREVRGRLSPYGGLRVSSVEEEKFKTSIFINS